MKINYYLPLLALVFMASCTEKSSTANQPQKPESTGEIVNKYVDTLTTAQGKAKKAVGDSNAKVDEENKAAQEMEKQ